MKINYFSYLDPYVYSGGAEAIMRQLLEWGRINRGHVTSFETRKPKTQAKDDNNDLVMLVDVFNCADSFKKINLSRVKKIIKTKRYIHIDNAYVDCCNLGYLPCTGKNSQICPYKKGLSLYQRIRLGDFGNACFQQKSLIREMYQNSILNVFESPLHRDLICKMMDLDTNKTFVIRPLLDNQMFYNTHVERDIEYLFVGVVGEAKGYDNLKKMFGNDQTKRLTIIGKNPQNLDVSFANYFGFLPYAELPKIFNRAKNFVYLPRWPVPQGRVVGEAALCGCKLITNENVGAVSYDFDISIASNSADEEMRFWDKIESLL